MTVRILTVCTGNICRSPYAQFALQRALDEVRPGAFQVTSAGTHALVGNPVDPGSVRNLDRRGITSHPFAAQKLTPEILSAVDFAIPMESTHSRQLVHMSPRFLKRSYPLMELARLLEAADEQQPWRVRLSRHETVEERWAALSNELARARALHRVADGTDDLPDPYRQGQEAFDLMAADVDVAVAGIAAFEAQFDA